jgi:hypothetical protein
MGHCLRCDEPVPDDQLLDHLRVLHPDDYGDGPLRWPDGALVVVDLTDLEDPDGGPVMPPGG